jgi:hypothetical protein
VLEQLAGDDYADEVMRATVDDCSQIAEELFLRCQLPITRLLDTRPTAPTECRFGIVSGSSPIHFLKYYFDRYCHRQSEVLNDCRGAIARGAAGFCGLQSKTSNGRQLESPEISADSIEIEVIDDTLSSVIRKGANLPCKGTRAFYTVDDY